MPDRNFGRQPNDNHGKNGIFESRDETIARPACPYRTAELCAAREASPSGSYAHQKKAQGQRRQEDAYLAEQIELPFLQSRRT